MLPFRYAFGGTHTEKRWSAPASHQIERDDISLVSVENTGRHRVLWWKQLVFIVGRTTNAPFGANTVEPWLTVLFVM